MVDNTIYTVTILSGGVWDLAGNTLTDQLEFSFTTGIAPPSVPVTCVTLDPTTLDLTVGTTSQLTTTVLPANATNQNVTWSSNNTNAATVDTTGLVTAATIGTATITVTTVDGRHTATSTVNVAESPPTIVHFECPNLETAVRGRLSIPTDNITPADMERIWQLAGLGRGHVVTSLVGLEYAINLTSLHLGENQISDINPLAGLTKLTSLGLSNGQLADITPLVELTNLTSLSLWGNEIVNIASLAGLTNLTSLRLDWNQINDITPLAELTSLTALDLKKNNIEDITPITRLINLPAIRLSWNQISDIAPVADLTNVTELELVGNQISDITPVAGLTNLTILRLSHNQITNIAPVAGLTNLNRLVLDHNQITDISSMANLTNLVYLELSSNQILDITPVTDLINLTRLCLTGNNITDISPVEKLTELTNLRLSLNEINAITAVTNLTNLTQLWLGWNEITDITSVASLTNLTRLFLNNNFIDFDEQHNLAVFNQHNSILGDLILLQDAQSRLLVSTSTVEVVEGVVESVWVGIYNLPIVGEDWREWALSFNARHSTINNLTISDGTPGIVQVTEAEDVRLTRLDIEGLKLGSTVLTIRFKDIQGNFTTTTLTINVARTTALEVSPTETTLEIDGTQQITATAIRCDASTKDVTNITIYTSSNPAVATVDTAGVIKAVSLGSSTITVAYDGHTATVSVTVLEAQPGISITGQVDLPGRTDDSGVTITVEGTGISTTSAADGSFTLTGVPAGDQDLVFFKEMFLVRKLTVTVPTTGTPVLPNLVTLKPGDANGDN